MRRFDELQGLRGLLALWVFGSHLVLIAWKPVGELRAPFDVLGNGSHAVNGFVILSGFVITHLLHERRESYGRFLWRRWCRLYPVFLFSILVSFGAIRAGWMPAQFAPGTAVRHLLVHLTLLHGLVPNDWLANAQGSLLPPAWSVSLEWQFYLVAPFVLWLAGRSPRAAWALSLLAFITQRFVAPVLGAHYSYMAFLPLKLGYFWLGIGSWFLVRAWRDHPTWATQMAPYRFIILLGLACLAISTTHFLGIFVWLGVLVLMLSDGDAPPSTPVRLGRRIMASRPLAWLGDLSYSVYLLHEIVVCLVFAALGSSLGGAGRHQLVVLSAISIPLTLAVCAVVHRVIERPGIRLGHLGATRS